MAITAAPPSSQTSAPPLSWPPPGLERMQGRLWRVIGVSWIGSVILVVPLLWELAGRQPFWSLGPFEGDWQVGMTIATVGAAVLMVAFGMFFTLMRQGADAAESGFGTLTIVEVMSDVSRDSGFLIQGRRHFHFLDPSRRAAVVRARLRGSAFVLAAALWLAVGFGIAVLLAARGFLTPSGVLLLTLGPAALLLGSGLLLLLGQNLQVRAARNRWALEEGADKVRDEARGWSARLSDAGEGVVLGGGPTGEARRFRTGATAVLVIFVVTLIPTATVALTAAIGPILAEIAVPSFLAVQEMAGAAETLRRYRIEVDPEITPRRAGASLQNVAFVGGGEPEPWEQRPETAYDQGWFPDPDVFPDPFSETATRDLMSRPLASFTPGEQAALRHAAAHPAHVEFHTLARAQLVDVVSARWVLPFPDTLSFQALPWPRFAAVRTAGLAQVSKAAVELSDGNAAEAEQTLRELISSGFLLMDQGPTLIDNLMGVVLVNMGGDALEVFFVRTGRTADAQARSWSREAPRPRPTSPGPDSGRGHPFAAPGHPRPGGAGGRAAGPALGVLRHVQHARPLHQRA